MEKNFDALSERIGVVEKLVKYLRESRSGTKSRMLNLDLVRESVVKRMTENECTRESLEERVRDLEKRENDFDGFEEGKKRKLACEELRLKRRKFQDDVKMREEELDEQMVSMKKHVEPLGLVKAEVEAIRRRASEKLKEIEIQEQNLRSARESLAERERKVGMIIETLDERIKVVEEREKGFNLFIEGKMKEVVLKEEQLRVKWEECVEQVKLADEKFGKQEKLKNGFMERLELAENNLEAVSAKIDEKFKEIESRENEAWGSVAVGVKEADLIRESMEKQLEEFDKMKSMFNSFQEDKMQELASKEQLLNVMSKELVKDAKLRNEQLIKREKVARQLLRRLELAQDNVEGLKKEVDERFKKICVKEIQLKSTSDWVERKMDEVDFKAKELEEKEERIKMKEADSIRGLMEKKLEEFEKMESESNSFQEVKMQELACKEQLLDVMSKELVKDAELRNEQLIEREKVAHHLLKRLELLQDNVEGLKKEVDERFKKICVKEMQLNSTSDWVKRKMDEVDSEAKKLKEKEMRIKIKKDKVIYKTKKLQGKEKELDLREKTLLARQKKLEVEQKEVDLAEHLNEQQQKKLDVRERSLNSVREFIRTCFNEHLAIKRKLRIEKDLVDKTARDLGLTEGRLQPAQRVLEFKEKQMTGHVEELELKQQPTDVLNDHLKINPDESVDLKFIVRMDGMTLQMFLNDPEKHLESMGDEIFKVLHLSSDPAKLVLDAMVGFYPPHLREGDSTFNVRRTCITLLQQFIRMSQRIKPHVRQEAIELATAWKAKMRATVENANSLEVLGFLLLLKAYDIASDFEKDEVSIFLKMVAPHREIPELCRILGFT